jgi:hypothetical protein
MSRLTRYWRYKVRQPWIGRRLYWRVSLDGLMREAAVTRLRPELRADLKTKPRLFIHIPKTGGMSLSSVTLSAGHLPWHAIHALDPQNYERILKFAIVRDPVDRFLSAYDFLARGGINQMDRIFARHVIDPDVSRFVAQLGTQPRGRKIMAYYHFRPQTDFVVSREGRVMVDRLIPFHDWHAGLAEIGIDSSAVPRKNVTPGPRTRREQLSAASIELLGHLYKDDYALLDLAGCGPVFGRPLDAASR